MTPAEREAHFNRVIAVGCLVTRSTHDLTIHHPHGGSLKARGFHRSAGRKTSDYLALPLVRPLHVGPANPKQGIYPIDGPDRISVVRWERLYRPQAEMIDELCILLDMDLWALAREEGKGMVRRAA